MTAIFQPYPSKSFFKVLPENLRHALLSEAKLNRFTDGEQIHRRGDTEQALSVIESGRVRFSNVGKDGKRVSLITLGAGESFGEFTLFAESPRMFDMHARGETTIQVIERKPFEALLAAEPELAKFIINMLARRLLVALEVLDDERRLPLVTRLAKVLLRRPRADADEVEIIVTQKDLADELTVSRVALGTALSKLRKLGLLETSYGRIAITNLDAMKQWVDDQSHLNQLLPED